MTYLCSALEIGRTNTLIAARTTDNGCYLVDDEGNEVLLPNAYVDDSLKLGEKITVFVYKDNEQRPVATTLVPKAEVDQFAFLEVKEVNNVGAFVDWGLVKQLLVPYAEQNKKMEVGKSYVVFILEDEKTERLIASSKLNEFFFFDEIECKQGDEVEILVYSITDLGFNVIVNNLHKGLLFHSDVHKDISIGQKLKAFVKNIRDDGKIDVVLESQGYRHAIEPNSQAVLDGLKANDGFLTLHDKSNPEDIKSQLGLSKKAFKRAIGNLYKQRIISIEKDGIKLIK